jgi:TatD DNase family protein
MLAPGIDLQTSRQAVELAQHNGQIFAAVGIHPHHASNWTEAAAGELRQLAGQTGVVAIGEIGLDYYRDRSPRPAQRRAFDGQLALAAELDLPVVIHNRDASADIGAALRAWSAGTRRRSGVLHAFSGDWPLAEAATQAGFLLGLAGPLTYKNADGLRAGVQTVAPDRLVLETDAPYLAPVPYRGKRNEPAFVRLVAEAAARLLDIPSAELAETTSSNADTLFGWKDAGNDNHIL